MKLRNKKIARKATNLTIPPIVYRVMETQLTLYKPLIVCLGVSWSSLNSNTTATIHVSCHAASVAVAVVSADCQDLGRIGAEKGTVRVSHCLMV